MDLQKDYSLRSFNSFGIDVKAGYFAPFSSLEELLPLVSSQQKLLILGGGSNVLFRSDFDGLVIKNEIHGISVVSDDENFVTVQAGAGETWQDFVEYAVSAGLGGVENLSLIPGTVGASPIQNIGAYGVELKDSFFSLKALDLRTVEVKEFLHKDAEFGYRDSVFKRNWKNRLVILNVSFRLAKKPVLNTTYGAIAEELKGIESPGIREVSDAVIRIRRSKLPDPKIIGNAGSFFKNPEVDEQVFAALRKEYPTIPGYPAADGNVKVAAGWLIEQCGWKGFRKGDAGCHAKQALVLVNYGNASGKEIYDLSTEILESVKTRFAIELEREVNII